jgi:hypothetical protein
VLPIPLSFEKKIDGTPSLGQETESKDDEEQMQETEDGQQGESEAETSSKTATPSDQKAASVSHVITNVIVFQSFLLELASLVQSRAGMFNEVRFV